MPRDLPTERSPREHADADGAHALLAPQHRELIEVLRGEARWHRLRRRGIQQVQADLRGVDGAARERAMERARLAERRHPEEADLALLLETAGRGYHGVEHVAEADTALASDPRDRIVEVEEIETRDAEQAQARLHGAGEGALHVGEVGSA